MRRPAPNAAFHVDSLDTPFFAPLWPKIEAFVGTPVWPGPEQYNRLARANSLQKEFGLYFSDVNDDGLTFEGRIAERGEIQCRRESWHDFFNAITAITFPRTKLAINRLQNRLSTLPHGQRDAEQNMLAHFEECGVVVLSTNGGLTDQLKGFRWKELFWHNREAVSREMRFIIYGHGLYAKAREPYIGLTGHAVIIECDAMHLKASVDWIDRQTADLLASRNDYLEPRDLAPVPLPGVPEWHPGNRAGAFYEDTSYFRPGRRRKKQS